MKTNADRLAEKFRNLPVEVRQGPLADHPGANDDGKEGW
jgi:hypothetical protein